MANLGHGCAFHFHRQRVRQRGLQRLTFSTGGDKAVTADDQPLVHAHSGLQRKGLGRAVQLGSERCVSGETADAIGRHLVPGEQRRHVEVVLQKSVGDHHVAHVDARCQATGHPSEHHLFGAETRYQCRGSGRRGHFTDTRQRENNLQPRQLTQAECATRVGHSLRGGELRKLVAQAALLFGQRTQNSNGSQGLLVP